jgi:hypothetical protein
MPKVRFPIGKRSFDRCFERLFSRFLPILEAIADGFGPNGHGD